MPESPPLLNERATMQKKNPVSLHDRQQGKRTFLLYDGFFQRKKPVVENQENSKPLLYGHTNKFHSEGITPCSLQIFFQTNDSVELIENKH